MERYGGHKEASSSSLGDNEKTAVKVDQVLN